VEIEALRRQGFEQRSKAGRADRVLRQVQLDEVREGSSSEGGDAGRTDVVLPQAEGLDGRRRAFDQPLYPFVAEDVAGQLQGQQAAPERRPAEALDAA
jgi:hypothetical protein